MNSLTVFFFALSPSACHEPVSSLTHLAGAAWFALLSKPLIDKARGNPGRRAALAVYAATCVLLLSISSIYHFLGPSDSRTWMRRADVAAIFLLIAGTFTPVSTILYRGTTRWGTLGLVWTVAFGGIVIRTVYDHYILERIGTGVFLSFGWLGAIFAIELWHRRDFSFVRFLVFGGVAYTLGAVLLEGGPLTVIPGLIRTHDVWHLAVLLGMGCHWAFISQLAGAPPETVGGPQTGLVVVSRIAEPHYSSDR